MRVMLRLGLLIGILLFVVACGTVAEPRPTFEPTSTSHARLSLDEEGETETVAEADSEAVEAAGAVGEVATEEHADDHEHAAETPVPVAVATEEHTDDHEHAATEEAAVAVATEEHADDHAHATEEAPVAAATEEHTDDHEHATEEAAVEEAEEGTIVMTINGTEYTGVAEYGDDIFHTRQNPDPTALAKTCSGCHNPDEPIPGIGPHLYGIASREGEHAEHDHGAGDELIAYLYESIVNPDAQIAPAQVNAEGVTVEWADNIMPENWDDVLTDQDIADVIAYLMTLDQASE